MNLENIPKEVVESALAVEHWMIKNGHRNWALMGICDRVFYDASRTMVPEPGDGKCRPTLDELACRESIAEFWTDKRSASAVTAGYVCHDYCRLYDREFSKWRDEKIKLLEIGLNVGASIKLWLDYFSVASIYGVDIAEFKSKVGTPDPARFTFAQGDQSDRSFWQKFIHEHGTRWDIIVDDGCHFSGPITVAFQELWPFIAPGGYYVIEDITEVRNPDSRTPGYPNQVELVQNMVEPVIFGVNDIDEIMISKDLCILRKKK